MRGALLWCAFHSAKPLRSFYNQINPFLRDSSDLFMRQTGNSFLFNVFIIGAQPRAPDVHHSQSRIKIWGHMPFLSPHPGPFIPQRSWRPTAPLSTLPHCLRLSLSHQGTEGWWGQACGSPADEEISQIASPAVNTNDSQPGGITETDASSSQLRWLWRGLSARAHNSPFALLRKPTA